MSSMPRQGGSYTRHKDGALKRVEWTRPAPARAREAEPEPPAAEAGEEQTAPPAARKGVKES
jgi:hypothetical protein